jgi:hypothetical protein
MCHNLVTRCASCQQYIDSVLQDQRCASRQGLLFLGYYFGYCPLTNSIDGYAISADGSPYDPEQPLPWMHNGRPLRRHKLQRMKTVCAWCSKNGKVAKKEQATAFYNQCGTVEDVCYTNGELVSVKYVSRQKYYLLGKDADDGESWYHFDHLDIPEYDQYNNDKVPHGLPRVARNIPPMPLAHAGREWIFFQTTVEEKLADEKIPESSFERHSRALSACPLRARLDVAPPDFLSDSGYGTRNNSRRTSTEPMPDQIGNMPLPQPNPVPSARPEDAVIIGTHNNNTVGTGSPQASLQRQYESGTPAVPLLPLDVDFDEAGNYIGIPEFAADTHDASVADLDVELMFAEFTNDASLLPM